MLVPHGLGVEGAILSDRIKSLDWRVRKARRIGNLPPDVLRETVGKILTLVDRDGLANITRKEGRVASMLDVPFLVGICALLLSGHSAAKDLAPACPVQGEPVQWVADFCMAQMETDDEIPVSPCIEEESRRLPSDACQAKMHVKRAMCALAVLRGSWPDSVEQCVADPTFMGRTVRNGGVGA